MVPVASTESKGTWPREDRIGAMVSLHGRSPEPTVAVPARWRLPVLPPAVVALRSLIGLLVVWQLLALAMHNPILLPTPLQMAGAFLILARQGEMLDQIQVSLGRLVLSLAIATALAVPLGFLM